MPLLGPSPLPVLLPRTSVLPCCLHRRRPDDSTRLQPRRPLQSAYSWCCCHGGTGDGVAVALGGGALVLSTLTTTPMGRCCGRNLGVAYFLYDHCELIFFLSLYGNDYELVATCSCVILIAAVRACGLFVAVLVHLSDELNAVVVQC
jgi:hypothetical protein